MQCDAGMMNDTFLYRDAFGLGLIGVLFLRLISFISHFTIGHGNTQNQVYHIMIQCATYAMCLLFQQWTGNILIAWLRWNTTISKTKKKI